MKKISNLILENALEKCSPINIAGVERSPLLIHYGANKYMPEKFSPIKNRNHQKPVHGTGLWTSPMDSNTDWRDYIRDDGWEERHESVKIFFVVCLYADAKIFVIDSEDDLQKAPLIDYKGYEPRKNIDFEAAAKKYDAIWLTEKGQIDTRHAYPVKLFGWDIESVLILNPNCIFPVDEL